MIFYDIALAQAKGANQPSMLDMFLPFILIFVIFYFLIIRPQAKKQKSHRDFLGNLKRGDVVLTSGGIYGTIEGITDKFVTLEIADEIKVKVLKAHIASFAVNNKENTNNKK